MKKTNLIILILTSFLVLSIGLNIYSVNFNSIKEEIISDYKTVIVQDTLSYFSPNKQSILGVYHNDKNFYRLKLEDQNNIRPIVWDLSKNSSGVQVHFSSNSPVISVKLSLKRYSKKANMNNIGENGVDLYYWQDNKWQFIDSGIPISENNTFILGKNIKEGKHKYLLNLPLYNTTEKIEIGIKKGSNINFNPHFKQGKPIVIYGTSITQGASASRPGMAYTNIISRSLNKEIFNLGFSGNGFFEKSIANIMCGMNAEMYIIDCTPNSSPEIIKKNAADFLGTLYECNPDTPILLVESIMREEAYSNSGDRNTFGTLKYINAQNDELMKIFENAHQKGMNIYYLEGENLIGNDHEGTVDGTHLSDLGMQRFAENLEIKIREIL